MMGQSTSSPTNSTIQIQYDPYLGIGPAIAANVSNPATYIVNINNGLPASNNTGTAVNGTIVNICNTGQNRVTPEIVFTPVGSKSNPPIYLIDLGPGECASYTMSLAGTYAFYYKSGSYPLYYIVSPPEFNIPSIGPLGP